eukprot:CAMPEP_0170608950 /NCGR_PEP_ID=MMETSP0224-20130122/21861_1 /TAXON_ID=285029 /ORGANISM="Togula jolla, Strain CCCM 725" /LENGTH=261 /DNA_ID=CAMNT_0010934217 /DNA_START=1 /DNA_END=783 /DNA_ORIENTATION=+
MAAPVVAAGWIYSQQVMWPCRPALGVLASWRMNREAQAETAPRRPRILVTGFNDWHGTKENLFRCRDNPSCRLLLGPECLAPPVKRDGPLPKVLRTAAPHVDWCFMTLPTIWGTAEVCDRLSFDAVFHIGLGVYDRHDCILLEDGAFNSRCSACDASGMKCEKIIDEACGQVLVNPQQSAAVKSLHAARVGEGNFEIEVRGARPDNTYICNETHFRALQAVALSEGSAGRLQAAYFVHIPQPASAEDFDPLAQAVGEVILR